MNPNIETEHIQTEILENNLKQIGDLVSKEGIVALQFTQDMQDTQDINDVLISTGFLKDNMQLKSFNLVACTDDGNTFEFGLCYGNGEILDSLKKFFCSLQYVKDEEYGETIMRVLQEEGNKPLSYTHCLFKEKLDRLSNRDKRIFEMLTLKFLEAR